MKARGLTLLELMIGLAVLAVLATVALPNCGAATERARLRAAAETLAADLNEARFESAQRGQPLSLNPQAGLPWCWAVGTTSDCSCATPQACQLKTVKGSDHAGITLLDARASSFDPTGTVIQGAGNVGTFQSGHGERLRVELSTLGRALICSPAAAVPGYVAC
jgi:type IV fimbrial biogenesis protein FimT